VASFGAKLLGALVLLAVLIPDPEWAERAGEDPEKPPSLAPRLRTLTALLAVAVVALSLLRFHNLGLYIAEMMLAATAVTGLLLLLRGILNELVGLVATHPAEGLRKLRRTLLPAERDVKIFLWFAAGLVDLTLLVIGLALLLPISGIAWTELVAWTTFVMRGVRIGEVTLSPADIASAVLLVIGIMAATRFLQRTLDDKVLEHLAVDRGVRNSIRTGIGYFGALLAIVTGFGTLGLSLSNLALIAGALSVGIGFGLQAIVSNFVAGLILLVERPIKVGDWIVIGEFEGVVKRISVRATEIQTFQFASVIIPNSELISKAVKNWTYKDKVGRIDIAVGVPYDCDLDRVRDILAACARSAPHVCANPPPRVEVRAFAPGQVALEVRCFVSEVNTYTIAATDLRLAILKTLREAGIELPAAKAVPT
ncbi:MAG: mechanosensitive ion channel domain-containing protein, partial [Rhodospirillaceae bacterium]